MLKRARMKNVWLSLALFVSSASIVLANGGAWQGGIPATGNASASKNDRHTDVTIENEGLKIDLHREFADVTVRYRMHNTGPKVQQDFFFPVERWGANPDSDNQGNTDDIDHYQITVDGNKAVKVKKKRAKRPRNPVKRPTKAATRRKKLPKEPARRLQKIAEQRMKMMKQLQGPSGKRTCLRSSHGKNRSSPLSETNRGT